MGAHPWAAELAVLVTDPQAAEDVNLLEVLWQGLPTGWILEPGRGAEQEEDGAFEGAFSFLPGSHGTTWNLEALDGGSIMVEVQARDLEGHRSGLWPYLTVE